MLFMCYVCGEGHTQLNCVLGWESQRSLNPVSKVSLSLRAKADVMDPQTFATLGEKLWEVLGRGTLQGSARQLCLSSRADSRDQTSSEAVVSPTHYVRPLSSPGEMGWWVQGQHDSADFLELIPRLCQHSWRCHAISVPATAQMHPVWLVHFWKRYLWCCM